MKHIKSWLRRRGVLPYKPYICGSCGFTVPVLGTRYSQASIALDHWRENHDA